MRRRLVLISVQAVVGIICLMIPVLAQIAMAKIEMSAAPHDFTPIYAVQGSGPRSPLENQRIDTFGIVTGVRDNGFFLQDVPGDGDRSTSDAIFVYTRSLPQVMPGLCVAVRGGRVEEFYAKTELVRPDSVDSSNLCSAQSISPDPMPVLHIGQKPGDVWEALEGMLVETEMSGFVQGPTKRYASGEQEIALAPSWLTRYVVGQRIFQHDADYTASLLYLSNLLMDGDLPAANWGDRIYASEAEDGRHLLYAVLDYNFGKYQLLPIPGQAILHLPGIPVEDVAERASTEDFTICTYNVHGLGRGTAQFPDRDDYGLQLHRRTRVIAERLQACTVVGLQETGAPADAVTLAEHLKSEFGLPYIAVALPGPASTDAEFPLTNSLLVLEDRVQVLNTQLRQACSLSDYGVQEMSGECPPEQYALFRRPPLVVDLAIQGNWRTPYVLRVINNHWKSKAGDERVNAKRRQRQAEHVASLTQEMLDVDPGANIVVMGDLNDFVNSAPIDILRTGTQPGLIQLYDFLPELDRYTYIFNGASQVLDHFLVTPGMVSTLAGVSPLHINADYADLGAPDRDDEYATSDHDPIQMRIRPDGSAFLGGNLSFPGIHVQLMQTGTVMAETVTDARGEFRIWDLSPGNMTVEFGVPEHLTLTGVEASLSLPMGYSSIENVDVRHEAPALAATMASMTPDLAVALVKSAQNMYTEP